MLVARGNLAVALERKGLKEEAIKEYRALVRLAPPGAVKERALEAVRNLTGEKQGTE